MAFWTVRGHANGPLPANFKIGGAAAVKEMRRLANVKK
jgi:hypothetical protein